jgi:PAS domain S-box-containing protein
MKTPNRIKATLALGFFLALLLAADIILTTLYNNSFSLQTPVITYSIWVVSALVVVILLTAWAHNRLTRRNLVRRQQAETALEEQHRFLRQVIDAIPNEIFVRDREGRYVLANMVAAESVDRSIDELIGTREAETNVSQELAEAFLAEDRRVMDTLEPLFLPEEKVQYPGGVTRWHQVSKLPLIDPDGTSNRVLVVLVDNTRNKLAEEALEEQHRFLREVIDANPNAIFVRDREGRYVLANTVAAELVGRTVEELLDTHDADTNVSQTQVDQFIAEDRRVMDTLEPLFQPELEVHYPGGVTRWHQVSKLPLIDTDGTSNRVLVVLVDITRINLAEEALAEQHRFLRQIIDALPNSVFVRDYDGRYLLTNDKNPFGPVITGEVVGENEEHLNFSPDLSRHFLEQDRVVMDTGQELFIPEEELTLPNGKKHWQMVTKLPLTGPDGISKRVLVVLVDITRSKLAEEALLRSEAQYRAAVEDHPGFIFRYAPDYTITFVNKAYCDFFGFTPQDVLGRSLLDIVAAAGPENMERTRQQLARVTPQNPVHTHEHSVINTRGEVRWVRWTDRLLLDESGEPLEYQASGLDITDRRQAEEALEEQRRFLRQIIDAIPNTIMVRNYSGRYMLVNNKEPHGATPGRVIGESTDNPDFSAEQAELFLQQDRTVMDTGQELFIPEEELILPNGDKCWNQVLKLPLIDADGTSKRVLVVMTDITERKKLETGIVNAEKLAGLGTLAAGIAHEINSPLQVITGKSESLQRRLEKNQLDLADLDNDLGSINRNAWRVARIVRSLLGYAHPSSGEKYPENINSLIEDTLLLIEHQLKTWSNITVTTDLAPDLPLLQCSSEEISRLLINLLTNARDAMPDGGEIAIRTRHDKTNRSVLLEIADTGEGIPDEVLPLIFNPFFTTKVVGKGTGLGLFIVYGIVQSYGGTITLDSQPTKGTTFTINLPQDPQLAGQEKLGRY